MEKFESNLFMKIGNFFFNVGFNYKTGGIKAVYRYYNIAFKLKIFKWRYTHSKKFRDNLIKGDNNLSNLFGKAIIEQLFFNKPIDYKAIYNTFTDEEKVKFKTNTEEALQKVIKDNNIIDEKEIENLRKMFDFENNVN
jgi:hypothetical protein